MVDTQTLILLLERLGFTKKEAEVYLVLLELNEALPSTIAKKSALKRPTVYLTLEKLQARGVINSIKKSGVLYYRASKPEVFLQKEKENMEVMKKTIDTLNIGLPELQSLHNQYAITPQMSVYYGKDGLIQVMEDTLTTKGELLCWSNIDLNVYTVLADYYPSYIKKKVKRKIWLKGIFLYQKSALEFKKRGKKELREVYLIPEEKFYFENEINIYDDKIAITSHKDQIGVIIQNKHIANAQKAIFNLAFEHAKELEKQLLTKKDIQFLRRRK